MPRREKNQPELAVRVSFETTRLSAQCLIEAYECLAPSRRRALQKATRADEARDEPGREGKHA